MTKIHSYDLGSTTGIGEGTSQFIGHIEDVKTFSIELVSKKKLAEASVRGQTRSLDPRVARFAQLIESRVSDHPDFIVFEDVLFGRSLAQVQLWSSFRGVLWSLAARKNIPIVGVATGTLKKWAAGNGGADKDMMRAASEKRWPTLVRVSMTHDEIDALALLMWGFEYYRHKQLSLGE